jgi:hypothetical protein
VAGGGVPLGITDAVALDGGHVLVSAVAEDTDDPVADGPVSAAALAVLDGEKVHRVDAASSGRERRRPLGGGPCDPVRVGGDGGAARRR